MKHIFLGFMIILIMQKVYSQSNKEITGSIGFDYFAIRDTFKASTEDSIRFMVSNYNENKPILIFIQGSGNLSLIVKEKDTYKLFLSDFFPDTIVSAFRLVFISKAGVPLCGENSAIYSKSRGDYLRFSQNDFLDYYVSAAKQTIDYLKANAPYKTKLYVVGHSQGYQVAAKLTAYFSDSIDKVVCMSSNPFGQQHSQSIFKIRQDEFLGRIEPKQAQLKIDSVYTNFHQVVDGFNWYQQNKPVIIDENYSLFRNDYSFNCEMAVDNLVKIKCPILVVYGSADIASAYNDLLPFFFARSNQNNLTLHCYPGYDHIYRYTVYSKDREILKEEFNWPFVFGNIAKWLKN